MIEHLPPEAWQEIPYLGQSEQFPYTKAVSGDLNDVFLVPDYPSTDGGLDGAVVKIPRRIDALDNLDTIAVLRREVAIVDMLNRQPNIADTLPTEVPKVLAVDPEYRWAAFSLLRGEVLIRDVMEREFSNEQLTAYGRAIGAFVADFAAIVDVPGFSNDIDGPYGRALVDKGKQFTDLHPHKAVDLRDRGYPQLAEAFTRLGDDYEALREEDGFRPTAVGHDDLKPNNTSIARTAGALSVLGVFDFGNVKLSRPARELRLVAQLGPDALHGAIQSYEETSGKHISEAEVNFWLRIQMMTGAIVMLNLNRSFSPQTTNLMHQAFPGNFDWAAELPQQERK